MRCFCKSAWYGIALWLFGVLVLNTSCVSEDQYDNTPQGNMEALWHIMDEHYCFFDYKKATLGVDWNQVYTKYHVRMNSGMTSTQQFEVLASMLGELRDGHVNLYSGFNVGRNWSWHENYPSNLSDTLLNRYLGTDYRIAGGMKYRILDDNTAYLRCASFESQAGSGSLDDILIYFAPCRKLIVDVRGNGGGMLTAAQALAARFTNKELLVGYMQHKTGKGHNDFSAMEEQKLKPSSGVRWQKPVVVLTNREVFSAANEFVKYMKCCPQVTVVGDSTGGGAGLPFSSELPNGWTVRFSACPMYDANGNSTENGIAPDYKVSITDADFAKGLDTIIEFARQLP